MAAVTMDLILDSSTDANFREWGKAISDRFAAFGWVKTADTGQIEWTVVTTSTTLDSIRGFEIWRMDDTLQTTAPVFLKIEYSTGTPASAVNINAPRFYVTLGTGSTGSGTLTGQVAARGDHRFGTTAGTTQRYRCIFSGDPSRFNLCLGVNTESATQYIWLNIERSKDSTGADTADGVVRVSSSGSATASQQFLPMSGTIPPNETGTLACMGPGAGTGNVASDVVLYPIFPFQGEMKNPIRGAVGYFKADITQDWIVQGSIYGATQNFYVVGHAVTGPMVRGAANGVALRYE